MTWPDLAALDLLVAVGEQGSVGAAARATGMTQPHASRLLRRWEGQLGLTLVQRGRTGSTLTDQGVVVVDWAREVLAAAEKLMIGSEALRDAHRLQVHVAASMTVAEHLLPMWLAELRRRQPDTRISVAVHNSHDVLSHVRAGACAVGFVESPTVPRGMPSLTVARDRLVVVVAPGHRWARRRRPLCSTELAATPLVVREPGSGTRATLESVLGPDLVAPTLELTSNAAVRASVGSGAGPAVLSVLAVHDALRSGELRAIPLTGLDLHRRMRAVWSGPERPGGAAGELIAIARQLGSDRR